MAKMFVMLTDKVSETVVMLRVDDKIQSNMLIQLTDDDVKSKTKAGVYREELLRIDITEKFVPELKD